MNASWQERDDMQIDVVMGGPGREAAVSRVSGAAIVAALQAREMDVQVVDCDGELDLARLRPGAVVFNIIHGSYGEDGTVQQLLDDAGFAYVGADAASSKLCMDKEATKALWREHELPVPWGRVIRPSDVMDPSILQVPQPGPLVLKPRRDGSSVGLRLLPSTSFLLPGLEELVRQIGAVDLLLEEQLPGPEYTVGVIDDVDSDGKTKAQALPPLEIQAETGSYDYDAKYQRNDTKYITVTGPRVEELQAFALQAYQLCGCRDLARIDFMADRDGGLRLLEINTLPGFTDHSLLPKAAAVIGIEFEELVMRLVRLAAQRRQEQSHA